MAAVWTRIRDGFDFDENRRGARATVLYHGTGFTVSDGTTGQEAAVASLRGVVARGDAFSSAQSDLLCYGHRLVRTLRLNPPDDTEAIVAVYFRSNDYWSVNASRRTFYRAERLPVYCYQKRTIDGNVAWEGGPGSSMTLPLRKRRIRYEVQTTGTSTNTIIASIEAHEGKAFDLGDQAYILVSGTIDDEGSAGGRRVVTYTFENYTPVAAIAADTYEGQSNGFPEVDEVELYDYQTPAQIRSASSYTLGKYVVGGSSALDPASYLPGTW